MPEPHPGHLQVWDKDFKKADDLIATGDVTLPQGLDGSMNLRVRLATPILTLTLEKTLAPTLTLTLTLTLT